MDKGGRGVPRPHTGPPEKVDPEENEDWLASNVVQLDRCEYKTNTVTNLLHIPTGYCHTLVAEKRL